MIVLLLFAILIAILCPAGIRSVLSILGLIFLAAIVGILQVAGQ